MLIADNTVKHTSRQHIIDILQLFTCYLLNACVTAIFCDLMELHKTVYLYNG